MSLINEALKKAQRQRSLESAPLSSAPSGIAAAAVTTHVRAASHRRSYAPLCFGLGLVSLGVVATVLVMRYGFSSEDAAPKPAIASVPAAAQAPARPAASPVQANAPAVAPVASEPAVPLVVLPPIPSISPSAAPAPAPAPRRPDAPPTPPASVQATAAPAAVPPASEPTPVTPVAVLSPAEHEAQVYSFINTLRLTGVRGLDREARVLMNERVWRLNDIVSPELGLRLSAVRPNLLVFTDPQGRTYEKPY